MDEKSSMLDGDEILPEQEIKKKVRKPLSEETLGKLAKAREKASQRRKEMAEERRTHKETLVQSKMEEQTQTQKKKDDISATKEARKRIKAKRDTIIIERSDSDSSSEDDIVNAKVYTVRKTRPPQQEVRHTPQVKEDDPLDKVYSQLFKTTETLL